MSKNRTNTRFDANDQFFLSNQLQSTDPTAYYHLVPGVVGRRIIPAIAGVSPNASVYKFKMSRLQGAAKRGGSRGRGAPSVSVVRTEETQAIKLLEAEASWTIDEVRASRHAGENLPEETMQSAVTSIEQKIDEVLAVGDVPAGIYGLANNPAIGFSNATAAWAGATSDQILGDITGLVDSALVGLKQGQMPGSDMPMFDQFALYLPYRYKTKMETTRIGTPNDETIMSFIEKRYSSIKSIKFWWRLDTANAGNPTAVLAPALDNGAMNPMAGGAILPMDFEQLPEQYDGRSVIVPCAGKCGGMAVRHAVAFRYLRNM